MHATSLARLIFIGLMCLYSEVPGERYRGGLDPHRNSAAVIEVFIWTTRSCGRKVSDSNDAEPINSLSRYLKLVDRFRPPCEH